MTAGDAKQAAVIANNCPTELGNIVLKVDEVLALLMRRNIVEVNVLVAPLEVMDDALVRQLLLHDENILEEVDDPLLNIKMIKLGNHRLLIFQIALVLIYQCIPLVDHVPDVVKNGRIGAHVQLGKLVRQILIFLLLLLQFVVHILNLDVVALELTHN